VWLSTAWLTAAFCGRGPSKIYGSSRPPETPGGALGAALFVWYQLLENERKVAGADLQQASLLGPVYSGETIRRFLDDQGAVYREFDGEEQLLDEAADMMIAGKIVGWFQGRMEFGPRALGNRSILADARGEHVQAAINSKVKFREPWRPFAPCVLAEDAAEYFDLKGESPYMLLTASVSEKNRLPAGAENQKLRGLGKMEIKLSRLPAVTHVDCSARIQTVDTDRHPRLHRLMKAFKEKTGCGVIVNTSFNVRGEPIVCTPEDAYRCFMKTGLDALVMEDVLLTKE
jgi:carbamoyltransferase